MNFNGVLIGSDNHGRLAEFYTRLFGPPAMAEGGFTAWKLGEGYITVGPHDEVKGENDQPGRLIWNIESSDVRGDFQRLKDAGAIVIREPYGPSDEGEWLIATLADPDNNFFQLVSPM